MNIKSLLFAFLTIITIASPKALAHNKVVVIPMAGDDAKIKPFAPLAAESPADSDYTLGQNTVIDNVTGLEWERDESTPPTWEDALSYCSGLDIDSKDDWRVPSPQELQSLVDYGTDSPAINVDAFPYATASYYWSVASGASDNGVAWAVYFSYGYLHRNGKTGSYKVRCVR